MLDYFRSYGPATVDQVAQWLGVPATGLRRVVATMTDEFVEVDLAGAPALLAATDADQDGEVGEVGDRVRLLPYFDPYVVGCHPRRRSSRGTPLRAR